LKNDITGSESVSKIKIYCSKHNPQKNKKAASLITLPLYCIITTVLPGFMSKVLTMPASGNTFGVGCCGHDQVCEA
jgi:hypothetical protein